MAGKYVYSSSNTLKEKNISKASLRFPMAKSQMLIGIITVHCQLKKYFNTGIIKDPIYRGYRDKEVTTLHLLYYCKAFVSSEKMESENMNQITIRSRPFHGLLEFIKPTLDGLQGLFLNHLWN